MSNPGVSPDQNRSPGQSCETTVDGHQALDHLLDNTLGIVNQLLHGRCSGLEMVVESQAERPAGATSSAGWLVARAIDKL